MTTGSDVHDLAGLSIGGCSVGGLETCIEVPEYRLAFDVGRARGSAIRMPTLLFTHAHIDHMGGVAIHAATRSLRGMPPPTYVVPPENVAGIEQVFDSWRRLDGSDLPHTLVALGPGEELVLPNGLVARPFRSVHPVTCQGYVLWSRRNKLKPEYRDRGPKELAHLRSEGVEITRTLEIPELAFTGDTRIDVIHQEPILRRVRRLVIECTFLDDRVSVSDARQKGHVHLDEIVEVAALFENEALLFTHFSDRYVASEVVEALDRRLPSDLRKRVTPLLAGIRKG